MDANAQKPAYDAIVVLGGGVNPDGGLPPISAQRVAYGIELQEREGVPFVVSGKWSVFLATAPLSTEAAAMKAYALSISRLMADDIYEEERSMETLGNAYFLKTTILEPHHWRRLVVITSEFHIPRATYLFNKALGPDYTVEFVAAPSGLNTEELGAKEVLEARFLGLYHDLLDPITAGDTAAIRKVLQLLPGYSAHPKYTRQELRALIEKHTPTIDTYGIN